jgi:hypothetical protein
MKRLLAMACGLAAAAAASAGEWTPLLKGPGFEGWVPVNIAPETFARREGGVVTTGQPIGTIRTERMYENFIAEFEWRHLVSGGNSGFFIWADGLPATGSFFSRGIEVQILDLGFNKPGKNEWYSTHGDIFAVNGALLTPAGRVSPNGKRSFPAEERTKPSPEWNHYRLVANDGEVRLSVNGKEVTVAKEASPRKGYLMLESEGTEAHFRNLRIQELPPTGADPGETAQAWEGFEALFNGLDFRGWKVPEGDNGHWKVAKGVIDYDALSEAPGDKNLWTEKEYGDFQMIVDWRIKQAPYMNPNVFRLLPDGSEELGPDRKPKPYPQPDADSGIYLRGSAKHQVNIWTWPAGSGEMYGVRRDKNMPPEVRAGVTPRLKADKPVGEWNRFDITVRGDTVTVLLNGQAVIPGVSIPGLPLRGKIALQHHGKQVDGQWTSGPSLVQFRNIFIRELPSPTSR